MALSPGLRVGPYEVVGSLGAGGMGEVYRARDLNLGRDVAIKVLPPGLARDLESGRETRLTSGVGEYTHPALSADGRQLIGTVLDSRQSLRRVTIQFDSPPRVEDVTDRRGGSGEFDPAWSPDGHQLVFRSSRTGNRNLWVMRTGSAAPAPLTAHVSPQRRYLVQARERCGSSTSQAPRPTASFSTCRRAFSLAD